MIRISHKNITAHTGLIEHSYAYPFYVYSSDLLHRGFIIRLTSVADYIEQETKGDTKENDAACVKQNPGNVLKPNNPVATSGSFGSRF